MARLFIDPKEADPSYFGWKQCSSMLVRTGFDEAPGNQLCESEEAIDYYNSVSKNDRLIWFF